MCTTSFYSRWRKFIRPLLILVYFLFFLIVVPVIITNSVKDGFKSKDQLVLIGGLFVLSAIPISFFHISQHIVHFTKPQLQKHIIRILWMVPIYAINAWLGLLFPEHSIYMDSLREAYEAYVIYNFMKYLLNYLNLQMDLEADMYHKPQVYHYFPLCCLPPWPMGREFIHNCKHGVLQYVAVRPLTTFIAFVCEMNGKYGEGQFNLAVAYPYITLVNNISQFVAMYCLVLFYRANRTELKPMNPFPKFACIKAVVFFSFFQGVIINFLVYFEYITNVFGSETDQNKLLLSIILQDFLLCIEMFLAAVAHHFSFPHTPFHINIPNYDGRQSSWQNAWSAFLDISDVHQDMGEHFGAVSSSLARRFQGRTNYQVPRGRLATEREYLVPSNLGYQSSLKKQQYGAVNIVKPPPKKEDDGFVQANLYAVNYPTAAMISSNSSVITTSYSSNIITTSSNTQNTNDNNIEGAVGGQCLQRSDSNNSDWMSEQPPNEFDGLIKGLGNDFINYRNPNV